MKFETYHISSNIKKNLANLGFKRPTDIQYKAIPSIMKGEDVLAIAQTGTGKTAAFAIPIIDKIHRSKKLPSSMPPMGIMYFVSNRLSILTTNVLKKNRIMTKGMSKDKKTGKKKVPSLRLLDFMMD